MWWRGVFVGGQLRPYRKGAGPKRNPILEVPFYLCIHHLTQNYQISSGNTCGRGLVFDGQPRNHPKGGGVPALPSFGSSFLFMRTPLVTEQPILTW